MNEDRFSPLAASRVFHARLKLERADREQRLAVCPTVRAYRLMVSGREAMRRRSDDWN